MEAPEYLDLDEIDFSDDAVYCVASLKNIPELSRRSDVQGEERAAPPVTWSRSGSSHGSGGGVKPPGLPEVHSKFRPVKRVSPLKHQPETSDADPDGKTQNQEVQVLQGGGNSKEAPPPDRGGQASSSEAAGGKAKGMAGASAAPQALFGELEHYDLDMDEILDVPYIKSSQQTSTLPRTPHDKHPAPSLVGGTLDRKRGGGLKGASLARHEPLSLGSSSQTPYCVLSPVKWSDLRKSKSMDPDLHHLHRPAGGAVYQAELSSSGLLSCSSSLSSFSDADKLLSARVYPDSQSQKPSMDLQGGSGLTFPLAGCSVGRQDGSKARPPGAGSSRAGELDDETKKNNNIINIIREGQISLLPHLAADNLELIRDEQMNNLLHVAASQGHADCLQHLTSLMGEDGLNERNAQQLTPAGLGVKHGHLECVRWMVSETEAIAELSCSREHPSLIHYAAQYGQEKVLLWLLQFMQEQAISLDEVDQNGNTAVHIAAQYGHLTCIQTLVEYGSNVTVQNQQSERPSQTAERQGNPTCARYLVVVETCMSLASQVVKLTKQLNEQATERLALQNQLHRILEPKTEGMPSASSHQPSGEAWPEMILTAEGSAADGHWVVRQGGGALDPALRQLLGKDVSDVLCPNGRPPVSGARESGGPGGRRAGLAERRELKLARLKQLMQRSLSESDSDGYPPEDGKAPGGPRPERPSHLPVAPDEPVTKHLHLAMKRHLPSSSSSQGGAKPADGGPGSSSPNSSDPDPQDGRRDGEVQDQKATSPKSALKSPSSRRKSAHALKLRVTFDEQVHKSSAPEAEPSKVHHGKERTPSSGSENKRPFGAFRSIMESLSGNTNHNNNTAATGSCPATPAASGSVQNTASRKQTDSKGPGGGKAKSKTSNV